MSPRIGLDRNRLLDVAIEIANQDGIHAVTMATLAKRLNIRPPSLYNHIDGLPALRNELALYGLEQLHSVMVEATTEKEGDDVISAISFAYLKFTRTHPGLYEATLYAPDNRDPKVEQAGNKIVELALNSLNHFQLDKDDAIHTVRGLRSILHGFSSLEQSGGFGIPINSDKSLDFIIKSYLKGIKNSTD
ncbi:TetR family transcriptional regulator [Aquibacillus halophilus]|uniref:TetR family transcriptional regulator n=1 Tax=Aquibacillus halophilus TaxID=930132 RepID=A0A6A8DJF7_9BACI|nr:TetR/AcrR family transcriptional regulator [Aquibacillus halophilus]MRH43869.1 TetR family transcriptional regulator [Aquibacillus halophilus]